jgi:hypothetical protein
MLDAVVSFAMFPVLRHRLQVRPLFILYRIISTHCIEPIVFITDADMQRTLLTLVLSIGGVTTVPGVPYEPSICDIAASHRPPIAIRHMDLRRGPKLDLVRRPSRTGLGAKVQKVSDAGHHPRGKCLG